MKKYLKPKYFPVLILALGILGCVCSLWFHADVDQRNLLNPAHPGAIILWGLCIPAVVASVWVSFSLTGKMRYERLFPRSTEGAVGTAIGAVAIAVTGLFELTASKDPITTATGVIGILAGICLLYPAWCRFVGTRPHFLPRCLLIVYLMLHLLCRYRVWSAEPELLRYFFELAATVLLTLACYYRSALEVRACTRRPYVLTTMLGVFFTLAALPGATDKLFLCGLGIWAITDRCNMNLRRQRRKPEAAA
jgi:hypothetical protein